ncbi:hypothetical protein [Mucilaginibacter pedocola]|nr:hypothetical protein [Mucilaginibacter pedocola]
MTFKDFQYLGPAIGVCIGWLLSGITTYLRGSREDRKVLKSILYHLLNAYALLHKLRKDNLDEAYRQIYSRIPELSGEAVEKEFLEKVKPVLIQVQAESVLQGDDLSKLREGYKESLKELSRIRPVMAYYISDSVNIDALFSILEKIIGGIAEAATGAPDPAGVAAVSKWMQPHMAEHGLKSLRSDIRYVAIRIGPLTCLDVWRILKRLNSGLSKKAIAATTARMSEMIRDISSGGGAMHQG